MPGENENPSNQETPECPTDMSAWMSDHYDRTAYYGNRLVDEITSMRTLWLNQNLAQMSLDNPRAGRLVVSASRDLYHAVVKHVESLQQITFELRSEMNARFPQLNGDFEGYTPFRPWTTFAPTPPSSQEGSFHHAVSEQNGLGRCVLNTENIITTVALCSRARENEVVGNEQMQLHISPPATPNSTDISGPGDREGDTTDEDDRSSESSSTTVFIPASTSSSKKVNGVMKVKAEKISPVPPNSRKSEAGKVKVESSTATATRTSPKKKSSAYQVDGLEDISDDELSAPETEVMISPSSKNNRILVNRRDNSTRATNQISSKPEDLPLVEVSSSLAAGTHEMVEDRIGYDLVMEAEDTVASDVPNDFINTSEILDGEDSEDIVSTIEKEGDPSIEAPTLECAGDSDGDGFGPVAEGDSEMDHHLLENQDTVQEFQPNNSQPLPNPNENSGPCIVKVESVITSSQESDSFQPSTPGYARLFENNPNDLETVDDEMPSTSSQFINQEKPRNVDESEEESQRDHGDATDDESLVSSCVNSTVTNRSFEQFRDPKLHELISQVVVEKLGPLILQELRRKQYIVLPDENSESSHTENELNGVKRKRRKKAIENEDDPFAAGLQLEKDLAAALKPKQSSGNVKKKPSLSRRGKPKTRRNKKVPHHSSSSDSSSESNDSDEEDFESESNSSENESNFPSSQTTPQNILRTDSSAEDESEEDDSNLEDGSGADEDGNLSSDERKARRKLLGNTQSKRNGTKESPLSGKKKSDPTNAALRSAGMSARQFILMTSDEEEVDCPNLARERKLSGSSPLKSKMRISSEEESGNSSPETESPSLPGTYNSGSEHSDMRNIDIKERYTFKRRHSSSDSNWDIPRSRKTKTRRRDSSPEESETDELESIESEERSSSTDTDSDIEIIQPAPKRRRRNIRPIMDDNNVNLATRRAEEEEEQRKQRVKKRNMQLSLSTTTTSPPRIQEDTSKVQELILDRDECGNFVQVDKTILLNFKDHQRDGVKFMWDTCIESVSQVVENRNPGTGCIIAHCMGLGKSIQALTFIHTVLTHDGLPFKSALVAGPKNTVTNWSDEYKKWLECRLPKTIPLYDLGEDTDSEEKPQGVRVRGPRVKKQAFSNLRLWESTGGLAVCSFEVLRKYYFKINPKTKSGDQQATQSTPRKEKAYSETNLALIKRVLFEPGPDIAVFDEGHLLKNLNTGLFSVTNALQTKRRIILTGTPLQNNLDEYYNMVSLVKPDLLGSRTEFANRFKNPIQNGAHIDSSEADVACMKKRSHVLHKTLDGVVQRKDYSVLVPFLAKKYEYTIHINLSEVQKILYKFYTEKFLREKKDPGENVFFQSCTELGKICTHPSIIKAKQNGNKRQRKLISTEDSFSDSEIDWLDDEGESVPKDRIAPPPVPADPWYKPYLENEEYFRKENIELSGKLVVLKGILEMSEKINDKVLIISQYLTTLDLIEELLKTWDEERSMESQEMTQGLHCITGRRWRPNLEYYRLDGATKTRDRKACTDSFNKGDMSKAKCFLLTSKLGVGINLTGANRVVLFDASFNPAQDMQSIFRVYRFGQTKPCYVYRLLSHRTLEEKIYNNQVVKLSLAGRVVDEQQIARHFNAHESKHEYLYDEKSPPAKMPPLPSDRLLADLITRQPKWIAKYGEHDSLLADRKDEELTNDERQAAMDEFKALEAEERTKTRAGQPGTEKPEKVKRRRRRTKFPPHFIKYLNGLFFEVNPRGTKKDVEEALNVVYEAYELLKIIDKTRDSSKLSKVVTDKKDYLLGKVVEKFGHDETFWRMRLNENMIKAQVVRQE